MSKAAAGLVPVKAVRGSQGICFPPRSSSSVSASELPLLRRAATAMDGTHPHDLISPRCLKDPISCKAT